MTINIVKKVVIFIILAILIVLVAGCTVNLPAETTTTLAPTTTTRSGLTITCIDGKVYAGNICPDNITAAPTTTTTPERIWGPTDVSIKMITTEMGCDDIGGFYTLRPELTLDKDFPYVAASITFAMTGGEFPEIYTIELKADGSYEWSDILDYADSCDVVFQAEVTAVVIHYATS